jgi:glyceraldehyde 3-phosphate dehydrogenase
MKKLNVAINGFGRIGRLALRRSLENNNINVVAINDLTDVKTLAHLFKYDSVHGKFNGTVEIKNDKLIINDIEIVVSALRNPEELPWKKFNIDVVMECTGVFRTSAGAEKHLKAGAKKVVISAPAKSDDIPMVVLGVNEDILTAKDKIISNASCTTNCLAPMVKVLDDAFGVEKGVITTIHSYTAAQRLLDAPHKDLRRARAAGVSIVPTTTGAAIAVGKILPHLNGKLDGKSIRVPTPDGSITDLVAILKKEATIEEINNAMKDASLGSLKNILFYTEDPIVSVDIISNPYSCIFDSMLTSVDGKLVKVFGWYDNEMGYASRLVELVAKVGNL